jgi:hypothetical protein
MHESLREIKNNLNPNSSESKKELEEYFIKC